MKPTNPILVVGAGTIGKPLAKHPYFRIVPRDEFHPHLLSSVSALVNCAGIVGDAKCKEAGFDEVMKANVDLPMTFAAMCRHADIPLFQPSTTGVYKRQTCEDLNSDTYAIIGEETYPHNLYCASKLLMEKELEHRAVVIRLPWFCNIDALRKRAENWKYVQDTWTSYFYTATLQHAVMNLLERRIRTGLFQVSSGIHYFPDYVKEVLGKDLEIRTDHARDMTSAIPIRSSIEKSGNLFTP